MHAIYKNELGFILDHELVYKNDIHIKNIPQLYEFAVKHNISDIWIMSDENMPGQFDCLELDSTWSVKPYNRHGKVSFMSIFKRGVGRQLKLINLLNTAWNQDWQELSARELLHTINLIEKALNIHISSSPGAAGWDYLKKLHPTQSRWFQAPQVEDWNALHFSPKAGHDIIHQRPMNQQELKTTGLSLVKFDASAWYPYAASQCQFGVGTPVESDGNEAQPFLSATGNWRQSQAVGVWLCKVSGEPHLPQLPQVFDKRHNFESWLTMPMIRLLRYQGYNVEVGGGYKFEETHSLFKIWARSLWNWRLNFRAMGAAAAERSIKRVMNTTIGLTAYRGFDVDEERRRPDIRLQVVSTAAELEWHNCHKVWIETKLSPVIEYMDAFYYILKNADGLPVRDVFLKRAKDLGGIRYEGSIPLVQARDILLEDISAAKKLTELNKIGWQK